MTQRAVEKKKKRSNQIIRPCILGCSHVKTSLELPKITVKSKLFRKYTFFVKLLLYFWVCTAEWLAVCICRFFTTTRPPGTWLVPPTCQLLPLIRVFPRGAARILELHNPYIYRKKRKYIESIYFFGSSELQGKTEKICSHVVPVDVYVCDEKDTLFAKPACSF